MFRKLKVRSTAMRTIATLLSQAEEIAQDAGAARPAAEHLVQAALRLPDGTAARALGRLGATAADFAAALEAQEADDLERIGVHADRHRIGSELPEATPSGSPYRSDPSAQQLFRSAGDDARCHGGALVGAHVLRSAASLQHGPTARALRRMGIDGSALLDAANAEIEAFGGV